ncbi:T9SS type A sorting domain-containing protein [Chryseobacterium sp. ES2]|uniref:T9SS type A sorting domain-containing protein n=1 Tax=Chryseobacterium metallicongregator TaxID=3073042 RepID=A0ABU1DZS3_9FLAO|nr:T9SS type A sorting domain-containing protein [Chryseobacterium sp. ES2]MDR4951019.1 T9SS type A sorting domain-containing protein [Chryseobacterium sp. ES2]
MLQNSTVPLTFGEEYTTCNGTTAGTSVTADVVIKPVARSYTHDYALAEVVTDLSTIPGLDLSQIYINGYDRTETAPTSGTYIGFPGLEKKRIGTYNTTVNPNVQYYNDGGLGINLIATTSGFQGASGGASGSPIFDQNKRTKSVVFAVGGGDSNADGSSQIWTYSLAGAWIHGENETGGTKLGRTMQVALDPENTSLPYTNGIELTEMRRLVNGAKYIVSKKTGYALGISGTSLVTDTQNTTTPGLPNKFILKAEPNGFYSIGLSGTATTLTCNGRSVGDFVRTSDYVRYAVGVQRFRILPTGKGDNSYYIQDLQGGLNLALQNSSNSGGVPIILGTQSGNDLEEWYLTDVAPSSTARTSGTQSREMQDSSSSISVYPVPAVDYLSVKVSSDKKVKAVSVVNTMGREVFRTEQISLEGQSVKIDVQKLMTGNYMVNVVFTDGSQSSAKFLKK